MAYSYMVVQIYIVILKHLNQSFSLTSAITLWVAFPLFYFGMPVFAKVLPQMAASNVHIKHSLNDNLVTFVPPKKVHLFPGSDQEITKKEHVGK